MVDKDKNKGSEFDDGFDDDFSDVNFDDISFEDNTSYDDMAGDDIGYEGDDFESEEWGEGEEETQTKNKKPKKSGGGLSFNAIVIIGAVVLGGGVLAFNVMRETKKAETAKPAGFQSILGIGGIMDGTLFGDKTEQAANSEETSAQDQGFLNNPDAQVPANNSTPPQPAPIAPVDGQVAANEPLTPMPDMPAEPSTEAPRGPNDTMPDNGVAPVTEEASPSQMVDVPPAPSVPADETQSAEDILKQAMANRDQKQQQETAETLPEENAEDSASAGNDILPDALDEKISDVKESAVETAKEIKEDVEEIPSAIAEKLPAPAEEAKAPTPEESAPVAVSDAAVTALSEKLDTLMQRMERIEEDLGTIREDRDDNTAEIEKTVSALKKDLAELKNRPASTASIKEDAAPKKEPVKKKTSKPVQAEDEAYVPPASPASPAPVPQPKTTATSSAWELRAAQPGRAWVSKPGERDMQAVSVGENLAGIGRITSITYQNGRWIVAGTQGSITQ